MSLNVQPLSQTGFGDVKASTDKALTYEEEMMRIQHFYKVKSAKIKTHSAISKNLTAALEECSRRMA